VSEIEISVIRARALLNEGVATFAAGNADAAIACFQEAKELALLPRDLSDPPDKQRASTWERPFARNMCPDCVNQKQRKAVNISISQSENFAKYFRTLMPTNASGFMPRMASKPSKCRDRRATACADLS